MGKMQLYDNKEIEWKECPGCEFANHSFNISCGIAYENDTFHYHKIGNYLFQGL